MDSPLSTAPEFATNRPASDERDRECVADAINGLVGGACEHLATPPALAISTAYFNPGGFSLVANSMERAGRVRLLLGAEPTIEAMRERRASLRRGRRRLDPATQEALDGHARTIEHDRNLLGFDREADGAAKRLVDWLDSTSADGAPRVEVRRFTDGFMHGKCFIVEAPVGGGVLAGSSNFTYAGLAKNRELNLGQYQPDTVGRVREWFNELWDLAESYDLAGLYRSRWEPHDPRLIFYRMLWELYGAEVEAERDARRQHSELGLTEFQGDGAWRAKRILDSLSGVIIADEVGLGKTYLAAEIIREAAISNRQKVLIICPAALTTMWRGFLDLPEINLPADVVSFDRFSDGYAAAGQAGSPLQKLNDYALVVIDEAHAIRNPKTLRAESIRALLEGESPKKLVLLTATPVNNSLEDMYTLISYFVSNDATFADSGIPSLREYFKLAMSYEPDDLSPEHLFEVMDRVAVRRTREFVKQHYAGDRIFINGEEREIQFPKPRVERIDYSLEDVIPGFFEEFAAALGAESAVEDTVILEEPGRVLTMARYVRSRFLKASAVRRIRELEPDADVSDYRGEGYERQNAGLLRSMMLKRFESSAAAFVSTVSRLIDSHDSFLEVLGEGYVLTGDPLNQWTSSDSDDLETFLAQLDEHERDINVDEADNYEIELLTEAVTADRDLLVKLRDRAQEAVGAEDAKFDQLVEHLVAVAADADRDGVTERQRRNNRKVLVFSSFTDTVDYLYERLQKAVETDDRLEIFRERIASVTGSDRSRQTSVIAGFAPETAGGTGDQDLFDLVVTTDVLSEGVNLQQARNIINYDLPWNPMRLVQRYGRIDRIGSNHAEVFIRVFFPSQELDRMLFLEERLQHKIKSAAAAVGVREVLPGIREVNVNLSETREEIDRLRREDGSLFESGGSAALSGESYRRRLERFLESPADSEMLRALPWGAGAAFAKSGIQRTSVVFCARVAGGSEPWFRLVELDDQGRPDSVLDEATGLDVPSISSELLVSLSTADTGDGTPHPENIITDELYESAFDSWEVAQQSIVQHWNYLCDPANLRPDIPKPLRDARDLVLKHGQHLAAAREHLLDQLAAPHSTRVQRAIREVLRNDDLSGREKVDEIRALAKRMNLKPYEEPVRRSPITADQVHVIAWMAIVGDSIGDGTGEASGDGRSVQR